MKKKALQIVIVIVAILLIIVAIQWIRSSNKGNPNQEQKGNPFKQPAPKKQQSDNLK